MRARYRILKRAFDIAASAAGLALLSPLLVAIAVAVRLDSPGPVLYRGRRMGRYGREFYIWKFRTMVTGADRAGPGITVADDSRVTRVGRLLRRTKLDELPQLVNVLRGEMSIVGPRPEDPRYVALYTPEQRAQILSIRPGLTSPASVRFRDEEAALSGADWETAYVQQIMPAKLALDLEYVQNASLLRDVGLIVRTVAAMWG